MALQFTRDGSPLRSLPAWSWRLLVGPDYSGRQSTCCDYRFAPSQARDTANTAWWRQFGDPVLDGLIDEALGHNWGVRNRRGQVEAAAAVLTQVRAPLFPQVGYSAQGVRERLSEDTTTPIAGIIKNPRSSSRSSRARAGRSTCGAACAARARRRARNCCHRGGRRA